MRSQQDVERALAIAREITLTIAPAEAETFRLQAAAFRADPDRVRAERTRDDPLGSAYGAIAPLVAPVAIYLGQKITDKLTDQALDAAATRGGKLFHWLRQRFSSGHDPSAAGQLPDGAELVELHDEILTLTADFGWTPEQRHEAADAAISVLTRSPVEPMSAEDVEVEKAGANGKPRANPKKRRPTRRRR